MNLVPVSLHKIQPFLSDFQRRAKHYEPIPSQARILGIFEGQEMAGYFVVVGYDDGDLEINQGYLLPEFRHLKYHQEAMKVLEADARAYGYRKIILSASRSPKAYHKFMDALGYKPTKVIFSREI